MSLRSLIQVKVDGAKAAAAAADADLAVAQALMDDAVKNFGEWVDYEPEAVKAKVDALLAESAKYGG